ncbi:uncharacterized protein SCHCODRAFT_02515947 [Schizophyllum commune H4-8]|nr:uncharacterized protein SCHCODRAFT_01175645 [Schizophyllum commune H4-8]XP_050198042.1 uncharacterized protein SCHCODRAFT_02515947 [Schizophyllum commune H4-8]KAI5887357.1 hypothetical protein SCHCODRAFT_02515947 [Schizophyllum commune H4-8]KAI5888900.1 hypothetical protein SCHCODRAFT_01175645 [Schizophyllum commune H4-8]
MRRSTEDAFGGDDSSDNPPLQVSLIHIFFYYLIYHQKVRRVQIPEGDPLKQVQQESHLRERIRGLNDRIHRLEKENTLQAQELSDLMNVDDANVRLAQKETDRLYKATVEKDKQIATLQLTIGRLRFGLSHRDSVDSIRSVPQAGALTDPLSSTQPELEAERQRVTEPHATSHELQSRAARAEAECAKCKQEIDALQIAVLKLQKTQEDAEAAFKSQEQEMTKASIAAEEARKTQESLIVELTKQLAILKASFLHYAAL